MMYVAGIGGSILQREAFPPNQNFASQPGGVPLKGRPVASLRCGSPVQPEPSAADCGVRLPLYSLHRHRLWHRWRQGGKAVFQSRFRYHGSPRDPLFPANAGLRAAVVNWGQGAVNRGLSMVNRPSAPSNRGLELFRRPLDSYKRPLALSNRGKGQRDRSKTQHPD